MTNREQAEHVLKEKLKEHGIKTAMTFTKEAIIDAMIEFKKL